MRVEWVLRGLRGEGIGKGRIRKMEFLALFTYPLPWALYLPFEKADVPSLMTCYPTEDM